MAKREYKVLENNNCFKNDELFGMRASETFHNRYHVDDEGIYLKRSDGNVYPLSHPDLSTQPSVLPQRFGVFPLKEIVCPYDNVARKLDTMYIPSFSIVIQAFAFNSSECRPVVVRKLDRAWCIETGDFVPDYAIVRYYESIDNFETFALCPNGFCDNLAYTYDTVLKRLYVKTISNECHTISRHFMKKILITNKLIESNGVKSLYIDNKISYIDDMGLVGLSPINVIIRGIHSEPIELGNNVFNFNSVTNNANLYVDESMVDKYKMSSWKVFFNEIIGI